MNTTPNKTTEPATSQEVTTSTATNDVSVVRSTEQWNVMVSDITRQATDLVALPTVQQGYQLHGHPASLGFQHLSTMTMSRLKKAFPLIDKSEPLYAMLIAQGKLIVGQEILKKYEARFKGKTYDYTSKINSRFKKLIADVEKYREQLALIAYEENKNA